MSYNILAYFVYLFFMFPVIIRIGQICYADGLVYVMQIFNNDTQLTLSTNKILLICYYLLNLGYTLFSIGTWSQIHDMAQMFADLSSKMGVLLLLLGVIHIMNMLVIVYVAYFKKIKLNQ